MNKITIVITILYIKRREKKEEEGKILESIEKK